MKALVLVTPPPLGPEPSEWKVGRGNVLTHRRAVWQENQDRKAKRFTDAELAAEYWRAATIDTTYWGADDEDSPDGARAIEQTITLKRFATLPAYDEATR